MSGIRYVNALAGGQKILFFSGDWIIYCILSDSYQEEVARVDMIPSLNSDHSAIVFHFNSVEEQKHGPSYWKFNASLLEDFFFVSL